MTNCSFIVCLTGFLDKNNDSLNRNLKEVRTGASPQPFNDLAIRRTYRVYMSVCGLVNVQVMCQSENPILRHCFRREEVIDQKRPEMVTCLTFSICLTLPDVVFQKTHIRTNLQKISHSFMFHFFSLRLPLSLKTAWWNWWRSWCLKSRHTCAV